MISRLLLAFLLLCLSRAPAADFQYGPRPPVAVFDPSGMLLPRTLQEISAPLDAIRKSEGIDVIVVILPDIGDAPPAFVAGQFAQAWGSETLRCVVLYVPNRLGSPWIFPSGKLLDAFQPAEIDRAIAQAQHRVLAEPKDLGKLKAAATESTDLLRYWMASAVNHTDTLVTESQRRRTERDASLRTWKIAGVVAFGALIAALFGISLLLAHLRGRGPAHFPTHSWQTRLGAPHAGGNHAVASLGPPSP